MSQLIIRLNSQKKDVEILRNEGSSDFFKVMDKKELIRLLGDVYKDKSKRIPYYTDGFVGIGDSVVAIKQEKHKKYVSYDGKSYRIEFPSCLCITRHNNKSILSVEAYAYKKWIGMETELFIYPFPNMLSGNRICMGSADTRIYENDIKKTLENIIFTQYTHSTVTGIKGFDSTIKYFEYLEKNPFPEHLLMTSKQRVGDLFLSELMME